MEALREELKQLIKEINILNQILLSSQMGENLGFCLGLFWNFA